MTVIRKYIPLSVRVVVAERQLRAYGGSPLSATTGCDARPRALRDRLSYNLRQLFGDAKVELHHRPALENRPLNRRKTDHIPPANDPDHLVYLLKDEEHRIETYVRGINGQLSDAGLRRKEKRRLRKLAKKPKKLGRAAAARMGYRWPPRGSRKIQGRSSWR